MWNNSRKLRYNWHYEDIQDLHNFLMTDFLVIAGKAGVAYNMAVSE